MALEWMPRDNETKDHALHTDVHWGTEAPTVVYEKRPLTDPKGNVVEGLFVSWIRLLLSCRTHCIPWYFPLYKRNRGLYL